MRRALLSLLVIGASGLAASAAAQTILHVFPEIDPGDRHAWSVAGLGDVDGDGSADLLVGAYHDASPVLESAGSVKLYSGAAGTPITIIYGDTVSLLGMSVHAAGDVDGDDVPDLIAGIPSVSGIDPGRARVWSGATFTLVHTFAGQSAADRFGHSVGTLGDIDGDDRDDLVVGAPWDDPNGDNSGIARVYSGASGAILHHFEGASAQDRFGWSVSGAGDIDGDTTPDILIGAPTAAGVTGSATVYSGADGSVLRTWQGGDLLDYFGYSVSGAGDVDGDGRDDVIVGAWGDDTAGFDAGAAFVFSGADGSTLHTWTGDAEDDRFGWSVSGAGDLDQDGHADLVVGILQADDNGIDSGAARVFSGVDGSVLFTVAGASPDAKFGRSVSDAGDTDGDCVCDLVVGAYFDNGVQLGSATVVSGLPLPWQNLGQALAGRSGTPCLTATGSLAGGSTLTLRATNALKSTAGYLVFGLSAARAPFKGGVLVPADDVVVPLGTSGAGALTLAAPWPDGLPPGTAIWLQIWFVDPAGPAGFAASNALTATTP